MRSSKTIDRVPGALSPLGSILLAAWICAAPAFACTATWSNAGTSNWNNTGNWTPATIPNSAATDVCIINGTGAANLDIVANVGNLTLASGTGLGVGNNTSLTVNGGTIANAGAIRINSVGNTTDLMLNGSTVLNGGGTLTLSNTTANRIYATSSAFTFTNSNNTIAGAGQIGVGQTILNNQGTINGNVSNTLSLQTVAGGSNSGLLEATSGGTLSLVGGTWNNAGGTILASGAGSVVTLNTTITGGNLSTASGGVLQNNSSAALNGVTITSGSTFTAQNNTTTQLTGTITNNGTFRQSSVGNLTDVTVNGTVTLKGAGVYTMSDTTANRIYGASTADVLVNQQTISGSGEIGVGQTTLNNQGTINANQSSSLTIDTVTTNSGTLEATAGGSLQLVNSTFNNSAGTILSSGISSNVTLNGATINGGNLTTTLGGAITTTNSSILNGVTITSGSTLTALNNTSTTLQGTITNNGNIFVSSVGNTTDLVVSGNVTLQGGGTVTLSNTTANRMYGSTTLNNVDNTIQGAGQIGLGLLTINNAGTINANVSNTLTVTAPVTNTHLLEATAGGSLGLAGTFTNTGGTILSDGAGSVVSLNGSTINGGSLTTSAGGAMQNNGAATLNGVTITSGSTLTALNNTSTTLQGTITNNGNIFVSSVGNTTDIVISGNVTLQGGGMVTLSNTTANRIHGSGANTLTNMDNTIQGAGQLGVGLLGIVNNGTILANVSSSLNVNPGTPGLTNNGTLQVASGSLLHVQSGSGAFTNFSGSTLTGGTYNVAGTLQVDQLGATGGEIVHNASAIILSGAISRFLDQAGKDGLSNFDDNLSTGSFTLTNGRTFTAPASVDFTNAGFLSVGGSSLFNTSGTGNYLQTAGTTRVDGTLTAAGGQVTISGGTLSGTGTVAGSVTMSGTIHPGDSPGTLTIAGNYSQGLPGMLAIEIVALPSYSRLGINGSATLAGMLDIMLMGYTGNLNDQFIILTSSGLSGIFSGINFNGSTSSLSAGLMFQTLYGTGNCAVNDVCLDVVSGQGGGVPEPSALLLMAGGLAALLVVRGRRHS